jgi:hypothetical protein
MPLDEQQRKDLRKIIRWVADGMYLNPSADSFSKIVADVELAVERTKKPELKLEMIARIPVAVKDVLQVIHSPKIPETNIGEGVRAQIVDETIAHLNGRVDRSYGGNSESALSGPLSMAIPAVGLAMLLTTILAVNGRKTSILPQAMATRSDTQLILPDRLKRLSADEWANIPLVADRIGVPLNGDPKQFLFTAMVKKGDKLKEEPVTVETLSVFAERVRQEIHAAASGADKRSR